jgi:hypothetical protein
VQPGWDEDVGRALDGLGARRTSGLQGLNKVQNSVGPVGSDLRMPFSGDRHPVRRGVRKLLVVALLAVGFFLAPTLQGINLVADQSAGATVSSRTADDVAAAEVLRMLERP